MLIKHQVAAVAAAVLLAGCGGGDGTETPQVAAASALRMRALSTQQATTNSVAPEVAAEQLMNYGESALPQYFPGHPTTQTFGPFRYRAYSNGILLGVVVTAGDPTYKPVNSVWVMGGVFGGQPVPVGMVTDYITPTDPNPPPTGANNGCADLSLADAQGTRLVITYAYRGSITGNVTVDTLVGSLTTFEGQQAREITSKSTGTTTVGGQSAAIDLEAKAYQRKTGDAEITNYGLVSTSKSSFSGFNSTTTTKTVWSPAWVDRQYGLALGQTLNVTQTGSSTITTSIGGLPGTSTTTPTTLTETVKYVSRESVTVPAGTYNACKYEHSSGGAVTSTNWVVVGKGVPVKTVSGTGSDTLTIEATAISLNGQTF